MARIKLADRIDALLSEAGGSMSYHDLAIALWPERRSHQYQSNGGPPGCYMALSAGLRRGGYFISYNGPGSGHRVVHARPTLRDGGQVSV